MISASLACSTRLSQRTASALGFSAYPIAAQLIQATNSNTNAGTRRAARWKTRNTSASTITTVAPLARYVRIMNVYAANSTKRGVHVTRHDSVGGGGATAVLGAGMAQRAVAVRGGRRRQRPRNGTSQRARVEVGHPQLEYQSPPQRGAMVATAHEMLARQAAQRAAVEIGRASC